MENAVRLWYERKAKKHAYHGDTERTEDSGEEGKSTIHHRDTEAQRGLGPKEKSKIYHRGRGESMCKRRKQARMTEYADSFKFEQRLPRFNGSLRW